MSVGKGKAKDLGNWKTRQSWKHQLIGIRQRFGNLEDEAEMDTGNWFWVAKVGKAK